MTFKLNPKPYNLQPTGFPRRPHHHSKLNLPSRHPTLPRIHPILTTMTRSPFLLSLLAVLAVTLTPAPAAQYKTRAVKTIGQPVLAQIETAIRSQRQAGHPGYNPEFVLVVDPAKQRMHVLSRNKADIVTTLKCATGRGGLGPEDGQTPTGFFTIGGVRIAKNADTSIQTGDTKKGVAGIYAEMLYPPSHPAPELRGLVPNNVVIHSYNPAASKMLTERREKRLVGRVPCSSGCPVLEVEDAKTLAPYLTASAGKFDPDARPNAALKTLIAQGKVTQHARNTLGGGVFIMGGRYRA